MDLGVDATGRADTDYREIEQALDLLTAGEADAIANMANAAALLNEYLPDINWIGFYRAIGDELVLGPFQGKSACIRIPFGRGVCGTAAASGQTQRVEDVHLFDGHIACDVASASELVVPIFANGKLVGVLDIDSPSKGRFGAADQAGCERLMALLRPRRSRSGPRIRWRRLPTGSSLSL